MGRIQADQDRYIDPEIPAYSWDEAVAYCQRLGCRHVTRLGLKKAVYSGELRRHLVLNRVCFSQNDLRAWLLSTANAPKLPRGVRARSAGGAA